MSELRGEAYNHRHAFATESVPLVSPVDRDLFGGRAAGGDVGGIDDPCCDFPRVPCDVLRPGRRRAVVVLGVQ